MSELLEQFLAEGRELVQQAAEDLLALEQDQANAARLEDAFRAVHTLKGAVALFDLAPMGRVLHAAEDLLEALRAGRVPAGRAAIDRLLDCVAASEAWLEEFARDGALAPAAANQAAGLVARLRAGLPQ
ncbi:Hpt domain-containing protein, partial [Siccirubricoccus sp. KC 17139]